jgi:hypothetical protein
MRKTIIIAAMLAGLASAGICGEAVPIILTANNTNAALVITGYANPFVGEVDEISIYTPSGVTGTVAVAAIDPYSGAALVLATNAVTGAAVWRPRIMETSLTGDASLVVTNAAACDRLNAQGESFRAVLSEASKTGAVFRVVIKTK